MGVAYGQYTPVFGKYDYKDSMKFSKYKDATGDSCLAVDSLGRIIQRVKGGSGWSLTGNAGTDPSTNFLGTTDLKSLVFKTNGTERMRLDSTGNVGIGTDPATGSTKLNLPDYNYIGWGGQLYLQAAANNFVEIYDQNENDGLVFYNGGFFLGASGGNTLMQGSGTTTQINSYDGTNTMYLNAGNVGIGTSTPVSKVDISGDIAFNGDAGTPGAFLQSNGIGNANTWANTTISTNNIAYVSTSGNDGTAVLGNQFKPYLTIQGALDNNTGVTFLKIVIGVGEFDSPPQSSMRDNVIYQGSGKPGNNSVATVTGYNVYTMTTPTHLIGGTILHGIWASVEHYNVQMYDLGVDVGSDWVTNVNGGVPNEGILFAQNYTTPECDAYHPLQTTAPPMTGLILKNISMLGTYGTTHGILVESQIAPVIDNITSCVSTYNLVLKTALTNVSNITLMGSSAAGLYLKSNCYANFIGATIKNLIITSFQNTESGGGLLIGGETGEDSLINVIIDGFNISRTAFGIQFYNGAGTTQASEVSISDGIIRDCRGYGLATNISVNNSSFRNLIITNNTGDGFTVNNGDNNSISGIRSYSNTGVGFTLSASNRLDVSDIFSNGNSGGSINYGSNVYTMGVTSLSGAITGSSTPR
jgi:hypothetical protein